jgi:hypothetical protein
VSRLAPSVSPCGLYQPLDLGLGQVFPGAQVGVWAPGGGNCSIYGGWGDQPEVAFGHGFRASSREDCSNKTRSLNSKSRC